MKSSILSIAGLVLLASVMAGSVASAQPATVSYQGQLDVNGNPHDGSADFKFAILCGTATAWSNDGTSTNGSEPTAAVTLVVQQGLFDVLLGDPALSMVPLTADLLDGCSDPLLRVWVDTGSGFEQLSDQPLGSSPFALLADAAHRSLGTFEVKGDLQVEDASGQPTVTAQASTGQLSVSSIRFGDSTVQTTAAGSAGADADWIIQGSDMVSGVAGNVGIGTTTPDRRLQIDGGTDIANGIEGGFLRIGNSALESILFDNNEIQAVDNGAPGGIAFQAEGGNVGIGLVNGSSKLHVVGDIRTDGLEGGGFISTDPNNTSAKAIFGWFGDVARIRIGGTNPGASNGLDIQTTSDRSLMRLLHNGNVGIGTTTPTERLEVAGNALVQGDLTVQGSFNVGGVAVGDGVLSLTANVLNEVENTMAFHRSSVLLQGTTPGQGLTFETTINLPNGATITEYSTFLTDNDPNRNIQTFLIRHPLDGSTGEIIATRATTGSSGRVTLTSTGLSHVVDNVNNAYIITANWTTPTSPQATSALMVHGFRVKYAAAP